MASTPPQTTAPFPEKVGKYELLLPIGSGGMATVFLARQSGVGGFARDVALKLVHSHLRSDEESKLHLLEEAKLSARIRHPNVVSVQEVGDDPFGLYLVMDYVEGDNLSGVERAARKGGKPLTDRLVARLLNDALLGLHAAHELCDEAGSPLGIVHRDFTPQNILVSIEGVTRLTDFGVAKAADRAVRTKTGLIKGKIAYMAPEQARGLKIDRRCDVWAAGVVAWELCARRRMYTSEDEVATLLRIVTERPPRLIDVVPDVNPELNQAICWALEPDPENRCPTAEAFRAALEAAWLKREGVADVSELSAFVRDCVGAKLIERQASITEMRSLRLRIEEIARSSPDTSDSEPTNDYPAYRTPPQQWEIPGSVSGHSVTVPSLPAHLMRPVKSLPPLPLTPHFGLEPLTETSAVLPAFVDRRPARLLWIVGALLSAVALFFAAVWTSKPARTAELTAHGELPAATTAASVGAQPSAALVAPTPTTLATSVASQQLEAEPPRVTKPASRAKANKRKSSASTADAPPVTKPGLASSPYGAQK